MRIKKEILKALPDVGDADSAYRKAILEVLIDIRDILFEDDWLLTDDEYTGDIT